MPAPDLETYKVVDDELSSHVKFNNLVQAIEDEFSDIDPDQVVPGANGQLLTTVAGVTAWANAPSSSAAPSGAIVAFGGSAAPTGWILCDGQAVSRTGDTANLFAAIGVVYGSGDGSTTFNVPDLRGRIPVGKGSNASVDALGENEGVTEANRRPQHRHTPHNHDVPTRDGSGGGSIVRGGNNVLTQIASGSKDGGSGNANDALDAPAHLVINYIIAK